MKKIVAIAASVALLSMPTSVAAGQKGDTFKTQWCPTIESLAKTVMQWRQAGRSMSEFMMKVETNDGFAKADKAMIRLMVTQAYEEQRWSTATLQERAAEDFAATWAKSCWNLN